MPGPGSACGRQQPRGSAKDHARWTVIPVQIHGATWSAVVADCWQPRRALPRRGSCRGGRPCDVPRRAVGPMRRAPGRRALSAMLSRYCSGGATCSRVARRARHAGGERGGPQTRHGRCSSVRPPRFPARARGRLAKHEPDGEAPRFSRVVRRLQHGLAPGPALHCGRCGSSTRPTIGVGRPVEACAGEPQGHAASDWARRRAHCLDHQRGAQGLTQMHRPKVLKPRPSRVAPPAVDHQSTGCGVGCGRKVRARGWQQWSLD